MVDRLPSMAMEKSLCVDTSVFLGMKLVMPPRVLAVLVLAILLVGMLPYNSILPVVPGVSRLHSK